MIQTTFKTLLIALLLFALSACDGLDVDALIDDDSTTDEEIEFTSSELAFNVLYSPLLLSDSGSGSTRDGFIALFTSTAALNEIEIRSNGNDDEALTGNYAWTIDDGEILITYPDGVTCTSTKTAESSTTFTASSDCDGGTPDNDEIEGTLNIPITFDVDDLFGSTITIENEDDDSDSQKIEFFTNGSFEITDLDTNGDDIENTTDNGIFSDSSIYTDVVRLDNSTTGEYSLLVLLDGSLSSGNLLELRYSDEATNTLEEIRIYEIDAEGDWKINSIYDDISEDESTT